MVKNQTSRSFLNCQQMGKVIRNFCWRQNFVPKGLSVPALGLYTCIKSFKMCLKSYFKEICFKTCNKGLSVGINILSPRVLWCGLTSQSTIFQSCRDGAIASWVINQYFRGVKCLAQGHNTAAVGLEPRTSCSGVRHSTTEPPRSPCPQGVVCPCLGLNV